jgi:hypothetical protein
MVPLPQSSLPQVRCTYTSTAPHTDVYRRSVQCRSSIAYTICIHTNRKLDAHVNRTSPQRRGEEREQSLDRGRRRRTHRRSCAHRIWHLLLHAPQEEQERPAAVWRARLWQRCRTRSIRIPAKHLPHKSRLASTASVLPEHATDRSCSSICHWQAGWIQQLWPAITCHVAGVAEPVWCCASAVAAGCSAGVWCAFAVHESAAATCAACTVY